MSDGPPRLRPPSADLTASQEALEAKHERTIAQTEQSRVREEDRPAVQRLFTEAVGQLAATRLSWPAIGLLSGAFVGGAIGLREGWRATRAAATVPQRKQPPRPPRRRLLLATSEPPRDDVRDMERYVSDLDTWAQELDAAPHDERPSVWGPILAWAVPCAAVCAVGGAVVDALVGPRRPRMPTSLPSQIEEQLRRDLSTRHVAGVPIQDPVPSWRAEGWRSSWAALAAEYAQRSESDVAQLSSLAGLAKVVTGLFAR